MSRWLPVVLSLAAVSSAAGDGGSGDGDFVLRAGRIWTGDAVLEPGTVVVRDGRIAAVGSDLAVPEGLRRIDLPRHVVIPGIVDAETALASDSRDTPRSVAPDVRAIDGWDWFADRRPWLRGGVTTVYISPGVPADSGRGSRLVSGRGAVVKVGGRASRPHDRLLREAGVQVTVGASSDRQGAVYEPPVPATVDRPFRALETPLPQSRAGAFLKLRRLLDRVAGARDAGRRAIEAGEHPPALDPELAALVPLLEGRDHLRLRAHRLPDAWRLLALARDRGLRVVLEAGPEIARIAPLLPDLGVPVLLAAPFHPGRLPAGDLRQATTHGSRDPEACLRLVSAGVPLVLHSPSGAERGDLLLATAGAVAMGLDPLEALRSITARAADVLGVGERVGRIAPGRDADLVVLGGDPFTPDGVPLATVIGGEVVWQEAPDPEPDRTVILCGRILTGDGTEIPGGVIEVEGRTIRRVSPGVLLRALPAGCRVVDASDRVVIPGLIDAGGSAGTRAESLQPPSAPGAGHSGGGGGAQYRLADAVDPEDPSLVDLARGGITTLLVTPDVAGQPCGQVSALKVGVPRSDGGELLAYAGMLFGPSSASSLLKKAKAYHDAWVRHEAARADEGSGGGATKGNAPAKAPARTPAKPPDVQEELDPLRSLLRGEVPAIVVATSRSAVDGALELYRDQYGMRVLLVGLPPSLSSADRDAVADGLRKGRADLVLAPPLVVASGRERTVVPAEWSRRGARYAIRSAVASGARFLPLELSHAVGAGLEPAQALRALTIDAARMFGIADRVGSIEPGKDADLVFLTGEPFRFTSRVTRVMVNGRWVVEPTGDVKGETEDR